jgi:hypothetical protein
VHPDHHLQFRRALYSVSTEYIGRRVDIRSDRRLVRISYRRTAMEITPDLVRRLKRLRLGGLLPTLPDRVAHARQAKLGPLEFLGPRSRAVAALHSSSPRKGACSKRSGCRKQRTTAGPRGGGIVLRIPWGKGFEK